MKYKYYKISMKIYQSISDIIKKLKFIMDNEQKKKSIILFVLLLIGSVFETFGISMIIPFMQALLEKDFHKNSIYAKIVSTLLNVRFENSISFIIFIGVTLCIMYLVKNAYLVFLTYVKLRFWRNTAKELSLKLFSCFIEKEYIFHVNINSSELIRCVGGDAISSCEVLSQIFKIIAESLTMLCIGIYLLLTTATLAIPIFGAALICFCIIFLTFRKSLKKAGENDLIYSAKSNQYLYQTFTGIKEIIISNKQDYFVKSYETAFDGKNRAIIKQGFAGEIPAYMLELVCVCALIVIISINVVAGADVTEFVPQLAVLAVAAFRILPSITKVSASVNTILFYRPALDSVYNSIQNNTYNKQDKCREKRRSKGIEKGIEIKDVSWKYPNSDKNVLENVNLYINKNESVAFIGASGGGKTTLLDILLGLLVPQTGCVKVDGVNILSMVDEWKNMIGYVPQNIFMTDDTIKNNIAFGIDEKLIDDSKVWKVLKEAQLDEFVEGLPDKLNTLVGESGTRLSGGQKQRIAIARALYSEPEIVVLDEATSALDVDTEREVMKAIEGLHGKKTFLIVAHRMKTIEKCDKIYRIENGEVKLLDSV